MCHVQWVCGTTPHPQQGGKRPLAAAQLAVVAQAAALTGAKRTRADAEVDASDPGVEVAPGVVKRRVLNPHKAVVDGTAVAENISQVRAGWRQGPGTSPAAPCQ